MPDPVAISSKPPLTRILLVPVLVAAGGYVILCLWLFLSQRSMIYFPQPRSAWAPGETFILPVDGERIVVSMRARPGPRALIYFGGNAEDVSANIGPLSRTLSDYSLYLMHYRGFGGSTGSPSEEGNFSDALALFDHVHARHPEIAVMGRSLGSGVAVRLASQRPAAQLVLVTPYDSLEEIAAVQFPYIPISLLLRDKYQSWRYAPSVSAPTLIVAAGHDDIVPVESSRRLLSRFNNGRVDFKPIPGTTHNDIAGDPRFLAMLKEVLSTQNRSGAQPETATVGATQGSAH